MTNQERIDKLQGYKINLIFIKRNIEKERNLNSKLELAEQLKIEILSIAKGVDKVIGVRRQVENEVIEGFSRCTIQKKMGINNQIKLILTRVEEVIKIFSK